MFRNRPGDERGVSLVEVMIALVVLLLVFTGLLQAALMSIDSNLKNILRNEAVALADEFMAGLKNTQFDDLDDAAGCRTVQIVIRNMTRDFTVCIGTEDMESVPPANTKRVEVIAGWNHRNENPVQEPTGNEFQHSISTVMVR